MDIFYKFTINGDEEQAVHGGRHRRKIKEITSKEGLELNGFIKNIKNKAQVEIKVMLPEGSEQTVNKLKELLESYCNEINRKNSNSILSVDGPHEVKGEDKDEYRDFRIIREDELTEMVWALQGAGDSFLASFEKQSEILDQIKLRDLRKEYARLTALHLEATSNHYIMKNAKEEIEKMVGEGTVDIKLRNLCLSRYMSEPISWDRDSVLLSTSQEVYYLTSDISNVKWGKKNLEGIAKMVDMLKNYGDLIGDGVKSLETQISKLSREGSKPEEREKSGETKGL